MGQNRWGVYRHEVGKNHLQLEDKVLGLLRSSYCLYGEKVNKSVLWPYIHFFWATEVCICKLSKVPKFWCEEHGDSLSLFRWQIIKDVWSKLLGICSNRFTRNKQRRYLKNIFFHLFPMLMLVMSVKKTEYSSWWASEIVCTVLLCCRLRFTYGFFLAESAQR